MDTSKTVKCIFLGLIFWFSGAMLVRFAGPVVLTEASPFKPLMLLALFPLSVVFVLVSRWFARLRSSEILLAVTVMTITATFCDGLALTYFRSLYAPTYEISHYGAATILFGAGAGLLVGWIMNRPE